MSAVPVPAVVVAGTSDLPSSVAFIFSAEAGPAKATAAPSASVASMVLVMVLSLLTSAMFVSLTTARFRIYSRKRPQRRKIFGQTEARAGPALALNITYTSHTSHKPPGHDGSVNAATNSPCRRFGRRCGLWRLLVADRAADRVGGHRARLHAQPCERTDHLQRRGMFLLPRRPRPARSIKVGRRTCHPLAIRHLLRPEYLARPRRRYRAMDRA